MKYSEQKKEEGFQYNQSQRVFDRLSSSDLFIVNEIHKIKNESDSLIKSIDKMMVGCKIVMCCFGVYIVLSFYQLYTDCVVIS